MIGALVRFVDALRAERVSVSPAEILDAGRALDLVDVARRAEVKAALKATLAKDKPAGEAFDRLFDTFFSVPRGVASGERKGRTAGFAERPREGDSERGRSKKPKPDLDDLIAREVPRMIDALKLGPARRTVRAPSGRPWLRRVMRENVAHGGVPFVIPLRTPRRKRNRVVLLVDVSFSVARASGLFLLMAGAFLELGRRARVLAFVDRPVDATEAIRRWIGSRTVSPGASRKGRGPRPGEGIVSRGASFADVVHGLTGLNLDAPSDYGTAFHALRTSRMRPRGRDTVLVVLGDGRTNRFDPLPWALDELARGCRAVLWLVPEPRSRWGTADSKLPAYLPSVDLVVETADLAGLARGLAELVRRL